jgi:hypothetical protein
MIRTYRVPIPIGRAVDLDSVTDPVSSDSRPGSRVLMTKNLREKNTAEIYIYIFFYQNLQFTYVPATGEAFSLQKRTSSTSKNKTY